MGARAWLSKHTQRDVLACRMGRGRFHRTNSCTVQTIDVGERSNCPLFQRLEWFRSLPPRKALFVRADHTRGRSWLRYYGTKPFIGKLQSLVTWCFYSVQMGSGRCRRLREEHGCRTEDPRVMEIFLALSLETGTGLRFNVAGCVQCMGHSIQSGTLRL